MPFSAWVWDLVDLSAALAAGDRQAEKEAFGRLEAAGRVVEVEESLLQSHLFLGYPTALGAFRRWRGRGLKPPAPPAPPAVPTSPAPPGSTLPVEESPELWERRGEEVCRVVYADRYERLRSHVAALHPDLDRWMVSDGYGKVLGRPGLDLKVREMCIVAVLVVVGAAPQLRAHIMGALNVGVHADDVDEVIRRAGARASRERAELAQHIWSTVRAKF